MHETPPASLRTRSAGTLVRRRAALAAALSVATLAGAAACGAFSLNEVVEGGTPPDGSSPPDGGSEGSPDTAPPIDTGSGDSGSGTRCEAGSCACTHPTLVASNTTDVRALSVVDGYLYWLAAKSAFDPTFHRLAVTVTDASAPPAIAPPIAWTSSDGLAITSGYLYVGEGNTNPGVENIPLEGGSAYAHVISKIPDPVDAIRVTPGGIYWTNESSEVCHAELDGGMPGPSDSGCGGKPLVAAAPGGSKSTGNDLAITDKEIYLAVAETGEIRVSPISGPGAKVVVARSPGPRAIFATDTDIVWGEVNGDGGI
jgi:hypothetical protein